MLAGYPSFPAGRDNDMMQKTFRPAVYLLVELYGWYREVNHC